MRDFRPTSRGPPRGSERSPRLPDVRFDPVLGVDVWDFGLTQAKVPHISHKTPTSKTPGRKLFLLLCVCVGREKRVVHRGAEVEVRWGLSKWVTDGAVKRVWIRVAHTHIPHATL